MSTFASAFESGPVSFVGTTGLPSMTAGQTPVIGGYSFTSQYAGVSGYSTFLVPSSAFSWGANVTWLNGQIATGQSFLVGAGGRWTAAEFQYLVSKSFEEFGSLLVPPVP